MLLNQSNAPDDYFNDLSRQPDSVKNAQDSPPDRSENAMNGEEPGVLKPKRIACVICRKRKLKCDGTKPSCATCSRLGHSCAYDEVRRKSGPKRGYVKELEARLAQVETQLKTKIHKKPTSNEPRISRNSAEANSQPSPRDGSGSLPQSESLEGLLSGVPFETTIDNNSNISPPLGIMPDLTADLNHSSWDMIRLGLEEPLPTQEAADELSEIYFTQIHPTAPMIHPYRHRAAMSLAPHMRPPVCLRYAMWCLAASVSEKYYNHQEIFYRRARKYAESDEMKGHGEASGTLAHAQCWVLLACYEFKLMYFPRAWASSGRASRLCMLMGLNRLDGVGLAVKQTIGPPRDWTDQEERRRTLWMAYCVDRYASIGTGWPMCIDEKDILTDLPASKEAFENSVPQQTQSLNESLTSRDMAALSPLGGVVLIAYYFGQNINHLHRPGPNEQEDNLQGEFWNRHRNIDNGLLTVALSLPSHLRLPTRVGNSNVVFLNLMLHTATITIHAAAIFKAERNDLPMSIIEQSKARCLLAAAEVATAMRLASHLDVATMNPFACFCLFVASKAFVDFLKKNPGEQKTYTSLKFLISAMQILKRRNPLAESFLIQLGMEMEGTAMDVLLRDSDFSESMMKGNGAVPADFDTITCSPLLEIRDPRMKKATAINFPKKSYGAFFPTIDDIGSTGVTFHGGGGTQSSLQNLNLPIREQRTSPQLWTQSNVGDAVSVGGIRVDADGHGWSAGSPSAFMNGFVDANAAVDTNMSESNSDGQRSSYLTPSTNQSSSNTSYSTPQEVEPENGSSNVHGTVHQSSQPDHKSNTAAAAPSSSFYSFVPTDEIGFPPSSAAGHQQDPILRTKGNDEFTVPPAWQSESTGDTPSAIPGLSPGDNSWVQVMEGMMWDGTATRQDLGLENVQWNGQSGSRT